MGKSEKGMGRKSGKGRIVHTPFRGTDAPVNTHSKMTDGRLPKCQTTGRRITQCRSATIKTLLTMPATVLPST